MEAELGPTDPNVLELRKMLREYQAQPTQGALVT
jgi:hypothetical protein